MATDYGNFQNQMSYVRPRGMGSGSMYDGTSSESSAASPLYSNGLDNAYGEQVAEYLRNAYPVQDPVTASAMGLIPVELDIEGLYETEDRRRKKSTSDKVVPPHVHSRRRAQNRASQRAFRDRKEKRMKEIEEKLEVLQGQHSDLTQSYETLQVEYAGVKQELDSMKRRSLVGSSGSPTTTTTMTPPGSGPGEVVVDEWGECGEETHADGLLFDVSAFCYEHAE